MAKAQTPRTEINGKKSRVHSQRKMVKAQKVRGHSKMPKKSKVHGQRKMAKNLISTVREEWQKSQVWAEKIGKI